MPGRRFSGTGVGGGQRVSACLGHQLVPDVPERNLLEHAEDIMFLNYHQARAAVAGAEIHTGQWITVDGASGTVTIDPAPASRASAPPA